jgi:hypothetical protein
MIPWLLDDYMKKRAANAFNHDIIRRGVPHSGALVRAHRVKTPNPGLKSG